MADYDVVIHRAAADHSTPPAPPAINARIQLANDLFVQRLPSTVAKKITAACNAGGVPSITPQRYAFVREYAGGRAGYPDFDSDKRIRLAMALSRLVWPTNTGLAQSAQVSGDLTDASTLSIRPGPITGPAAEAYNADSRLRNWLTDEDGQALKSLLAGYDAEKPTPRVSRALFLHEFAVNTLDGGVRWLLVAAALEALVIAGDERVSKQFSVRTAAIASELGVAFSKRDAREAYSRRSKVAHGSGPTFKAGDRELFIGMEGVLRSCIRRSISDPRWGDTFASAKSISRQWPVESLPSCPLCGRPSKSRGPWALVPAFFKELPGWGLSFLAWLNGRP